MMFLFLSTGANVYSQTPPRLTIHAASSAPVDGWQKMEFRGTVWISPVASITSDDIQSAEPLDRPNGDRAVSVTLSDAGLAKMRELLSAQYGKYIAVMFDNRVIWVPLINAPHSSNPMPLIVAEPKELRDEIVGKIVATIRAK
jgi:preprotein translocase subunit SecD